MNKTMKLFFMLLIISLLSGCSNSIAPENRNEDYIPINREDKIPAETIKLSSDTDKFPPQLFSSDFEAPIPLPYPVNTKGAEDSSFILPDGNTLYVWFTPDVRQEAQNQVIDQVTGIYVFYKNNDQWSQGERIWLSEPGKPVLDGCEFVLGNKMWTCTIREGYSEIIWATTELIDGTWQNWKEELFPEEYEVGELHISKDGTELFFHSSKPGGQGGLDIWLSKKENGVWQDPVNLVNVNSEFDEGWPALNPAEDELWISKNFGLWRSKKVDGEWGIPVEIVSPFAGEATIDNQGNVYFTHHFFEDNQMIESDIYVMFRK